MSRTSSPPPKSDRTEPRNSFLVTWNPRKYPWNELDEHIAIIKDKGVLHEPWTCWHGEVKKGDRIFLLRQGNMLPGIVASGTATSGPKIGRSYADARKKMPYVRVAWDTILNAEKDKFLPRKELMAGPLATMHWDTQRSGVSIPPKVASLLESKWTALTSKRLSLGAQTGYPIETQLLKSIRTTGFGDEAMRHFANPRFKTHEMRYKLQLAKEIREADAAYASGDREWSNKMVKAVCSNNNNIIPWRIKDWFKGWCKGTPSSAGGVIHRLLRTENTQEERIKKFSAALAKAGLTQSGAQVCLASVLLMAQKLTNNPPVRTDVIKETVEWLGLDWAVSKATPSERYAMFMQILDGLITFSELRPLPFTNRLEAQGAVWCVVSGWMDELRNETGKGRDLGTQGDEDLSELTETERAAVIAARVGQGRYRNDLLSLWLGCSITQCQNYSVLRASHLKPWCLSDNRERLDPYNGLLLTPNLDHLLDQHLVSFDSQGRIIVSQHITAADKQALGIHDEMRIRNLDANHQPYLKFHRSEFNKKEKLRNGQQ